MKITRIEVDSAILGRSVLSLDEFDPAADFAEFELRYQKDYDPIYVVCKIPVACIAKVHALERAGFNWIECQLKACINLAKPVDVSRFPYRFEEVKKEEYLAPVFEIASSTFVYDRFTVDPLIPSDVPAKRHVEYVRRSFHTPGEFVYRLTDSASGRVVAFKTHRRVSNDEVLFLLGGVHPDYKELGLGAISDYFEFNELSRSGIKRGITHVSAANYPIVNLEIGRLGFKILTVFAVMRKIYS